MLNDLIVQLRAMQLYYHNAHNKVKGPLFYQDHNAFSEMYNELCEEYDSIVERAVGKYGGISLVDQMKEVYKIIKPLPCCCDVKENKNFFVAAMDCENKLCELCEEICSKKDISEGVRQLVGEICNKSEMRQYKIGRRMM